MTTIGEQLKKFRLSMGLSQTSMAAGVVSTSFYSKLEVDKNKISIDKLVKILNAHHISFYDFFEAFDEENLPYIKFQKEIYLYFENRDLDKLDELKNKLTPEETLLYYELKLIIANLKNLPLNIPQDVQTQLKDYLRYSPEKQADFWNLAVSMPLYDFDELTGIVNEILDKSSEIDYSSQQTVVSLMNVLIGYLDRCYREKDRAAALKVIDFVNSMPYSFDIIFHKLIVKYYLALINNEDQTAQDIINLISESGYKHYAETLPKESLR
ncbi:helix-turn-helix transcriptional regulator [uncultured Lactobacillus sp.]|uniref:helix-turn-helix domain-containing protein n=1 Tax=uncultured Lactobacillus sp. TaxID=153152 RepID=UPI0028064094|nr:helix-turn-helix transcriptional regulator [uncultured Lactobacillus sp.]